MLKCGTRKDYLSRKDNRKYVVKSRRPTHINNLTPLREACVKTDESKKSVTVSPALIVYSGIMGRKKNIIILLAIFNTL